MHPSNDYYGQEMLLSWAASIHRPKRTFGYIQHGWKPEAAFPSDMRLIPGARLFVWSEENRRATAERFPRHRVRPSELVLYLYEMMKPALGRAPTKDLLVYPCHQLRGSPLARQVHGALVEQVLELEPTSITVNLHPYELADGTTEALYASQLPNPTLTTNWLQPPWVVSDDPTILIRQILQILDHRRVVSNCLTDGTPVRSPPRPRARLLHHPARRQPPAEGKAGRCTNSSSAPPTDRPLAAIAGRELGASQVRTPGLRGAGLELALRSAAATVVRAINHARGQ